MHRKHVGYGLALPIISDGGAKETQQDRLSALPPELRREVIFYTRSKEDRRALSLTNRIWKDTTLPILWEKLVTTLSEVNGRRHIDLVHPASNILKYVRHLRLRANTSTSDVPTDFLPLFLAAISKGQLRAFETFSPITPLGMQLLMQLHPSIEELDVPGRAALTTFVHSPWALGSLANLKNVLVYVDSLAPGTAQTLLDQCPNMITLHIGTSCKEDEHVNEDIASEIFETEAEPTQEIRTRLEPCGVTKPAKALTKLLYLDLYHGRSPKFLNTMLTRIDFSALRSLTWREHSNPEHLLQALATHYVNHPTALRCLQVAKFKKA